MGDKLGGADGRMKRGVYRDMHRLVRNQCVEKVIGDHGRYRLEIVTVCGKPTLRYVPDGPPAPLSSGDS